VVFVSSGKLTKLPLLARKGRAPLSDLRVTSEKEGAASSISFAA